VDYNKQTFNTNLTNANQREE